MVCWFKHTKVSHELLCACVQSKPPPHRCGSNVFLCGCLCQFSTFSVTCSPMNCPYVWFHRLAAQWFPVLNYALVYEWVCPATQPSSRREFLQSATLPLVCIDQGATLSVIFIFFFQVILFSYKACMLKSSQERKAKWKPLKFKNTTIPTELLLIGYIAWSFKKHRVV